MALKEGQYELDGFVFGGTRPGSVWIDTVDIDTPAWTTGKVVDPVHGRGTFPSGALEGRKWTFHLSAMTGDSASGRELLDHFGSNWMQSKTFLEPGQHLALTYMRDGELSTIYGRPESFQFDQNGFLRQGSWTATAVFETIDPYIYGEENILVIPIVPTSTGGGVVFPTVFPWISKSGGARVGQINAEGHNPTEFTAKIFGPIRNPRIWSKGWDIGLVANLLSGQSATIDTRTSTILRNDGLSLGGALTLKSRLGEARFHPGSQEVRFDGVDPTGSSRVEIRWARARQGY